MQTQVAPRRAQLIELAMHAHRIRRGVRGRLRARRACRSRACRMYAAGWPQKPSAWASRYAQVVLPFVPVMPAMVSACDGAPKKRSAIVPTRRLSCGNAARRRSPSRNRERRGDVGPGLEQHGARAARDGLLRELEPVMRAAAAGEEQRAGRRPRGCRASRPSRRCPRARQSVRRSARRASAARVHRSATAGSSWRRPACG